MIIIIMIIIVIVMIIEMIIMVTIIARGAAGPLNDRATRNTIQYNTIDAYGRN